MFKQTVAAACGVTVVCAAALSPSLSGRAFAAQSLTGAGSTFAAPFFTKAFEVYTNQKNVDVNYQALGSGAGIKLFTQKTVDFGATDVPMNPATELPAAVKAGGPVQQIPITLGGVSVAYNLPGIKTGKLQLTGSVLAKIFLGVVTKWNDKSIRALNKKLKLPDLQITVVHRGDGSGTSYIFTDYLGKVSDQWRGGPGTSKLPNWPTGVSGTGNPGVAQLVSSTPGAIGYVELAYVLQNHMKQAAIQNKAHQYQVPSLKTIAAAAVRFPKVNADHYSIVNAPGKTSYPIAGYTWALVFRKQSDASKGKDLVNLMKWTVTTGQKYAKGLDYVPLPKKIQVQGLSLLKQVKV